MLRFQINFTHENLPYLPKIPHFTPLITALPHRVKCYPGSLMRAVLIRILSHRRERFSPPLGWVNWDAKLWGKKLDAVKGMGWKELKVLEYGACTWMMTLMNKFWYNALVRANWNHARVRIWKTRQNILKPEFLLLFLTMKLLLNEI